MKNNGFTLIELSIVLVIIGLVAGGILVGQDMIAAATVRSQITQIEKYNTAANTFKLKYGYLPGDITASAATHFGFAPRGTYPGEGDGNGRLEGVNATPTNWGYYQGTGETAMFWVDLSQAQLIDGSFSFGSSTALPGYDVYYQGGGLERYLPAAKISPVQSLYVYSATTRNYFGLSAVYEIVGSGGCASCLGSTTGLQVIQAYNIDMKMDDGFPQSGRVTAQYNNYGLAWAGTTGTGSTAGSSTTCYDNNATANAQQQYSVGQSNGSGANCALSFQFQ